MWTEPTMPFGQSVIVSLLGLSVVFLALICLALAIMVISKILRSVVSDGAKARPQHRKQHRLCRMKLIRNYLPC